MDLLTKKWGFILKQFFRIVLICFITAPPTYSYKKVKCYVPSAPATALPGVKKLAVLDFESKKRNWFWTEEQSIGRDLTNKIIELLLQERRGMFGGDHPPVCYYPDLSMRVFEVVERSQLEQIIREQNLGQEGRIDQSQAAEIGKIFGAPIIIIGDISTEATETPTIEQRQYTKNKQTYTINVKCTTRKLKLDATMKILDVKTGEIKSIKSFPYSADDKWCEGDYGNLETPAELVTRAVQGVSRILVASFTPSFWPYEAELEKIKNDAIKDECDEAAKAAEHGDMNTAYQLYRKAFERDPFNPQLMFNLGVLHEVVGDLPKSKQFYGDALQLKDEKNWRNALVRLSRAENTKLYFDQMEIPLTPGQFVEVTSAADQSVSKIRTKGKDKDRLPVFEQPNQGSKEIGRVPGGIELVVLQNEGNWCRVKLPGNKEGYIHISSIKK